MKHVIILFSMLFALMTLEAETRTKNLDFVILLDKSLSMDTKIEDVKRFFTAQILDKELIPGDTLKIVLFYGKTEVLLEQTITGPQDIDAVKKKLSEVKGDGQYTDIGRALDFTMESSSVPQENTPRTRHFVLLTDGRQEAPPGSPYQSTDFSIKHPALDSAKNLARQGWKIQILGIGSDTEAENLAKQLSAAPKVFSTSQDLVQAQNINFFEDLRLTEIPKIQVMPGAVPQLTLNLAGEQMESPRTFSIQQIFAGNQPLLGQGISWVLPPNETYQLTIPLKPEAIPFITGWAPGQEISFQFSGDLALSPGILTPVVKAWPMEILLLIIITGLAGWVAYGSFQRTRLGSFPLKHQNPAPGEGIRTLEPPKPPRLY